jgi:hypothetical protein
MDAESQVDADSQGMNCKDKCRTCHFKEAVDKRRVSLWLAIGLIAIFGESERSPAVLRRLFAARTGN